MTTRRLCMSAVAVASAVAFLAVACGDLQQDSEPTEAQIESRLAQENGGEVMSDDVDGFGLAELLGIVDLDAQLVTKLLTEIPQPPQGLDESSAPTSANTAAGSNTSSGSAAGSNTPNSATNPTPVPPVKPCPGGVLKGRWKVASNTGLGFWRGGLFNDDGRLVGWLRGIFGRGRFFGKVISKGGKFRALIAGAYHGGQFKGRMFNKSGTLADVHGVYSNGAFKGRWITRCKPPCTILCAPNYRPDPNGACRCVPVACKPGSCPAGEYCDMCPSVCGPLTNDPNRPANNAAGAPQTCPAVCGTPICKPRPTPVPPQPAPCVSASLGDTTSCKSTATWKKYAAGACASRGLELTRIDYGTPCGQNSAGSAAATDLFRYTKFECCKTTTNCLDPADYCKAVCNGQHAPPIAPGCPIPSCNCGPSNCPPAADICRQICNGTKPSVPATCPTPACKCASPNSAGTP
ncbi:MAG: hypothetical protein KC503_16625 [Myxococcales bacterium]|nr:hypothetical protein [Myxococcales bacterium]